MTRPSNGAIWRFLLTGAAVLILGMGGWNWKEHVGRVAALERAAQETRERLIRVEDKIDILIQGQ